MELSFACVVLLTLLPLINGQCKCVPGDKCWPSDKEWGRFNSSVSGKLIRTTPPAAPCYAGPDQDAAACEAVTKGWTTPAFQAAQPIGYDYPLNTSCPLTQFTANAPSADCRIGNSPVYAVNVTDEDDISKAVRFASKNNIRVVVKSTGHDFLQRSTGYGSLSIWLQNYRRGYTFHDDFQVVNECPQSDWKGSALTITGAYSWSDLYPAAFEKELIVVGGNDRGPCSTGGWTQGGGHSPVTRYYGLGADQVLSARVVLASGEVVTASPCTNPDLFYAIRGGGGGTYGVVTQMTVKTYPTKHVDVVDVVVGIASTNATTSSRFLDAVTDMYSSFPYLSEVGFAGYGAWAMNSPIRVRGNFTTIYAQSFTTLGSDASETTRLFKPVADKLMPLRDAGFTVSITQNAFVDYGSYYANKSGTDAAVGDVSALASRLLGKSALEGDRARLRIAMETMAGANGSAVFHTIVHHGLQTAPETRDNSAAVQPGWYDSVILDIFERPLLDGVPSVAANVDLFDDIRQRVLPVYRQLSPHTGTYMNEADWGDPSFEEDFYSSNWKRLIEVKTKYDPLGVFYCQTCVGSDEWAQNDDGALCRRCPSRDGRCNGRNDATEGMCACW